MSSFRFLYREADGVLGPGQWARASALPLGIAAAMTLVAWTLAPGPRDLATQPFFSFSILATYAYFVVYSFALIVLAVMQYYVSAKRFNALGRSQAWAVYPFYALAVGVVIWNIVELGFGKRR